MNTKIHLQPNSVLISTLNLSGDRCLHFTNITIEFYVDWKLVLYTGISTVALDTRALIGS